MPKDVAEVRSRRAEISTLPPSAQEVLRFLGQQEGRAYDYREIVEGVLAASRAPTLANLSPFFTGLRAWNVGTALDGLHRAGFVQRSQEGARSWYYLPEGPIGPTPPSAPRPRSSRSLSTSPSTLE